MKQKILYCSDLTNLNKNLISAGFYYEEEEGSKVGRLPVDSEGVSVDSVDSRLTCVLLTEAQETQVNSGESLEVLGTYSEIFADPEKEALYNSVYDRSPKTWVDSETGETVSYTPSDKFNVFAGYDDL